MVMFIPLFICLRQQLGALFSLFLLKVQNNLIPGLGASILYSITNWDKDNQFLNWGMYPLLMFVAFTIAFQVNYLNKALAHFSATIVTPLNYVFFSSATIVTSSILYKGFHVDSVKTTMTIILGFFVIVVGVSLLLQYNLKMNKMALTTRGVEDINDEDIILETPADDNPLKLMSAVFPLDGKPVIVKSKVVSPTVLKTIDESNPANYVRENETSSEAPLPGPTIIINVPQVSLSQQIQLREELHLTEQQNKELNTFNSSQIQLLANDVVPEASSAVSEAKLNPIRGTVAKQFDVAVQIDNPPMPKKKHRLK
jgi:hypothetical protein